MGGQEGIEVMIAGTGPVDPRNQVEDLVKVGPVVLSIQEVKRLQNQRLWFILRTADQGVDLRPEHSLFRSQL